MEFRPLLNPGETFDGYATELHAHVKGTSSCAFVDAEEMIKRYQRYGYSTIVTTNHYGPWGEMTTGLRGRKILDLLRTNYERTAAVGRDYGMEILCGVEISFDAHDGDYLLYGFDWDFFYDHVDVYKHLPVEEFAALAHEHGFLIYHAHPCRSGNIPRGLAHLDGIEVYNGQVKHDNRNSQAYRLLEEHPHLQLISGSDFHQPDAEAKGGIITREKITSISQLTDVLRREDYTLLYDRDYLSL
jgi:hypothetical protein